jgi:hypothetical protein
MSNPELAAAVAELESAGIRDYTVAKGSRHIQVRWKVNGSPRVYTLSSTPSDVRGAANTRAGVRRLLRADELIQRSAPAAPREERLTLEQRVKRLEALIEGLAAARR